MVLTYSSQLFSAAAGIAMLPFYLQALGTEAYGVVGLGGALQSWLVLLDLGLSLTLSREAARCHAGVVSADEVAGVFRFVTRIFVALSILLAGVLLLGAGPVASMWLRNEALSDVDVALALRLLGGLLALRLLMIPWRALLLGFEDLTWLGGLTIATTVLRTILVLPIMMLVGETLFVFFGWQLFICFIEWLALAWRSRRLLPPTAAPALAAREIVAQHWRFSLGAAAAGALWAAATNIDKVVLSGLLPLPEYGMFTIATVAAGGVLLLSGPLSMAFGPRLTAAYARDEPSEITRVYGAQTELLVLIMLPAALVLILFPAQVLFAWTGEAAIAAAAGPVLALYAGGNALMAMIALSAMLQMAAGIMKMHVIGIILFVTGYLPLLALLLQWRGMIGAGLAWLVATLCYWLLFVPLVHRRFLPESHGQWLVRATRIAIPLFLAGLALKAVLPWPTGRWMVLVQLCASGAVLMAIGALFSSLAREQWQAHFPLRRRDG